MHMNHMTCLNFEAAEKFISVECNFRLNEPQNFRFFFTSCVTKNQELSKRLIRQGVSQLIQSRPLNWTNPNWTNVIEKQNNRYFENLRQTT